MSFRDSAAEGEVLATQVTRAAGPGKDGAAVEKELGRLPPLKTKAEYEPEHFPVSTARKAVERAQPCISVARRVTAP